MKCFLALILSIAHIHRHIFGVVSFVSCKVEILLVDGVVDLDGVVDVLKLDKCHNLTSRKFLLQQTKKCNSEIVVHEPVYEGIIRIICKKN